MLHSSTVSSLIASLDVFLPLMQEISAALSNIHSGAPHPLLLDTSGQYPRLEAALSDFNQVFAPCVQKYSHLLSLSTEIRSTCNVIAPINGLPDEILSRIFSLVPTRKNKRPVASPLCMSNVCRHWRKVAMQAPSLWTKLDLDYRSLIRMSPNYPLDELLTDFIITRSQHCDLGVVLCGYHDPSYSTSLSFPAVHRWGDVTIQCGAESSDNYADLLSTIFLRAFEQTPRQRPSLRSLTLVPSKSTLYKAICMNANLERVISQLAISSSLESLSFQRHHPSRDPVTYARLLHISFTDISSGGIPTRILDAILRSCTQLLTLRLCEISSARGELAHVPTNGSVTLSSLEELSVEYVGDSISTYVFTNVRAPALRSLALGCHEERAEVEGAAITAFILRTTSIRYLRLSARVGPVISLAFPALVNLEVLGVGDTQHRYYLLDYLPGVLPSDACPKLSELRIWSERIDMTPIQVFIEARAAVPTVAPIRTISFDCKRANYPPEKHEADRQWFCERMDVKLWKFYKDEFNYL